MRYVLYMVYTTEAWLINTGWTGGAFGKGHRMSLKDTRAIIDATHSGDLAKADYENFPRFNLQAEGVSKAFWAFRVENEAIWCLFGVLFPVVSAVSAGPEAVPERRREDLDAQQDLG